MADRCFVGPGLAKALETRRSRTFEVVAARTPAGDEAFTRDVPNVPATGNLDHEGLVRVGTAVRPGDLLVGRTSPSSDLGATSEERLLRSFFGPLGGRDTSLRAPPGVEGVVTAAHLDPPREGEVGRARVEITRTSPLEVGDVLADDRGRRFVVAGIRDGGVEDRGLRRVAVARDRLHARSIGPYALVSSQPLSEKASFGGQPVPAALLRTLVAAGAPWAAWELLTLKCDAVAARIRAYESLVKGLHPDPDPTPSETLVVAARELLALGIDAGLDGDPVRAVRLTADEVRQRSQGRVTRPETVDPATLRPVPDGLSCERIFGPLTDARSRRERFGHVELPLPVPHPLREGATLDVVPVLPADLRPVVPVAGGGLASSDLNALYARVVNRSNRLAHLIELEAPQAIREVERRLLGEAVAALFVGRASLTAHVGRHLAGLLGKPSDYSGVAHLVADPDVPNETCRLPRAMAKELLRPMAYALLEAGGYVSTIKSAKRALDAGAEYAVAATEAAAARWVVWLATPAGLTACRIALWDAPAIAVGPATAAFLAAEEATVHVPLTAAAVAEARGLVGRAVPLVDGDLAVTGWLTALLAGADVLEALRAAGAGAVDPVDDVLARLALGRRPAGDAPSGVAFVTPDDEAPPVEPAPDPRPVDVLGLSDEILAVLSRLGIDTVDALRATPDAALLKARLGRRQLKAIKEALEVARYR